MLIAVTGMALFIAADRNSCKRPAAAIVPL